MNQQDKDRLRELAKAAKNSSSERLRAFREDCMPEAILSLLEENEALARDAARYRWLRECRSRADLEIVLHDEGEYLDAAIDAAMQPKGD